MSSLKDPLPLLPTSVARARQRNILVLRTGSLGDSLIALPALRHIREQEPNARIILLTNVPVDGGVKAASSFQVLLGTGLVDDFVEYELRGNLRAKLDLLLRLRALHLAKAYYLMPVRTLRQRLRDLAFLAMSGCKDPVGLKLSGAFSKRNSIADTGLFESEASRLLRSVGGGPRGLRQQDFALSLSTAEQQSAAARLRIGAAKPEFIAFSVGTKSLCNDWGKENWQQLTETLARVRPNATAVFIGSADESFRCEALGRSFGNRMLNFCGALSPRDSAAILAKCDLFIGHDSGPMHLANSVSTPLVAIFSARYLPGIWFPLGKKVHAIYNQVSCAGCLRDICTDEEMRCIKGIEVKLVLERALDILEQEEESTCQYQLIRTEALAVS